jgi:hypothetical protein
MYYKMYNISSIHIYLAPLVKLNTAYKCDVYTHVPVHCTAVIADEDAISHTGPSRVACWAVKAHLNCNVHVRSSKSEARRAHQKEMERYQHAFPLT